MIDKYDSSERHYRQKPQRKAEFIKPLNTLKEKVGSGGLGKDIMDKAQALLESATVEFPPIAEMYLEQIEYGMEHALGSADIDYEEQIIAILHPAIQLKASSGMFNYPLISTVSDKLVQFLEVIVEPDRDAIDIVEGFVQSLKVILTGNITDTGGKEGKELINALDDACMRYFNRHPYNLDQEAKIYYEQF